MHSMLASVWIMILKCTRSIYDSAMRGKHSVVVTHVVNHWPPEPTAVPPQACEHSHHKACVHPQLYVHMKA